MSETREESARASIEAPESESADEASETEAPAPTPFDHPLFLPALLFAFALWFGYDGFLNDDPEMMEHQTFNRVFFAVWVVLLGYYGYRGLQEMREDRADAETRDRGSSPD
jgi:hypothetical protein